MKQISLLLLFAMMTFLKCYCQSDDTLRFQRPIPLEYPKSETVTVFPNDTLYFCADIRKNNFRVKIKGKWTHLDNIKQVQKFIELNHSQIEDGKILLIGDPKAKYDTYSPLLDTFKKFDYMKFYLVPRN